MKRPNEITFYPADGYKDENGGLWFRIPNWIVRAYRLQPPPSRGKVKFVIGNPISMLERSCNEDLMKEYMKRNWRHKINIDKQ